MTFPSNSIYIADSKTDHAGRGVFARLPIAKGEIIEVCPTIELTPYDTAHVSQSMLATYMFFFGDSKDRGFLVLGYGSLYNHSHFPNAVYQISDTQKTISFIATRNIDKDSEITFDYKAGHSKNSSPLWFEVK